MKYQVTATMEFVHESTSVNEEELRQEVNQRTNELLETQGLEMLMDALPCAAPGSDQAVLDGCNCLREENNWGEVAPSADGGWVINIDCPVHATPALTESRLASVSGELFAAAEDAGAILKDLLDAIGQEAASRGEDVRIQILDLDTCDCGCNDET